MFSPFCFTVSLCLWLSPSFLSELLRECSLLPFDIAAHLTTVMALCGWEDRIPHGSPWPCPWPRSCPNLPFRCIALGFLERLDAKASALALCATPHTWWKVFFIGSCSFMELNPTWDRINWLREFLRRLWKFISSIVPIQSNRQLSF